MPAISSDAAMGSTLFGAKSTAVSLGVLCVMAGCDVVHHHATLDGRAADEWTRSYALPADAEVQIVGASGSIDVQGTNGTTVEVRAERIARASTDAAARELLPRI